MFLFIFSDFQYFLSAIVCRNAKLKALDNIRYMFRVYLHNWNVKKLFLKNNILKFWIYMNPEIEKYAKNGKTLKRIGFLDSENLFAVCCIFTKSTDSGGFPPLKCTPRCLLLPTHVFNHLLPRGLLHSYCFYVPSYKLSGILGHRTALCSEGSIGCPCKNSGNQTD